MLSSSTGEGGGVGGFRKTQGEMSVSSVIFTPDLLHLTCETSLANLHFRKHTNLKRVSSLVEFKKKKKPTKILFYIVKPISLTL